MIYNSRIYDLINNDRVDKDELDALIKQFTSYGPISGKNKDEAYEALLGINKICEKHNMPLVYVDDGTVIEKDLAHRLIDNLKRDEYGKNL
ncbi:MAG: hypothetical protein IJ167_00705 [Lachnospiraceae bacterium]|nr:hypothetical protein [Lachnospiraceae bacterium]